ncbi:MAG: hypothetical protein EP330_09470 [Deltaproteobacteria bacterium]|nr:MAG: hypothetical protein EP330_09470 [Deltaproteobacteria bacterium]
MCPSCGHRPTGEGLAVAWLLSDHNLDRAGLDKVSARIRAGEHIQPGRAQLDKARRALQSTLTTDPGLTSRERVLLLACCLLLTPLPAWIMAWWWRRVRPRAAVQSLALAVPTTALFTALGLWGLLGGF